MLITARAGKVSLSGSILLLGFTVALLTAALVDLAHGPVRPGAILRTSITAGLVLVMLSRFRIAAALDSGRLAVRTPFWQSSVDSRSCALGVSTDSHGKGGTTYTIYATDGTARAELAECWTKKGAARARRRLEACFAIEPNDEWRSAAQARVDAEHQRTEAQFAAAQRQVDTYYQSGAFRRVVYWVVGGVLIYIAGACVYAWVTGVRL